MTGVPWLVPTPRPGGITGEMRRALGPLATLVEDPRVNDVFVLGGGEVYVDTGSGTYLAEGLHLSATHALDIARGLEAPVSGDLEELIALSRRAGVPIATLARAQVNHDRDVEAREATRAVGALSVHLVLPLGLLVLPAFVLIAVFPVAWSIGTGGLTL